MVVPSVAAIATAIYDVARATWAFTMMGTLLAYRRRQRNPAADPFPVIVRRTMVGVGFGLFLKVVSA